MLNFLLILLVGWPAIVVTLILAVIGLIRNNYLFLLGRRDPGVSFFMVSERFPKDQLACLFITVIPLWLQFPDVPRTRNARLAHRSPLLSNDPAFVLCRFSTIIF